MATAWRVPAKISGCNRWSREAIAARRPMVLALAALSDDELRRYADALVAHHFHGAPHPWREFCGPGR